MAYSLEKISHRDNRSIAINAPQKAICPVGATLRVLVLGKARRCVAPMGHKKHGVSIGATEREPPEGHRNACTKKSAIFMLVFILFLGHLYFA